MIVPSFYSVLHIHHLALFLAFCPSIHAGQCSSRCGGQPERPVGVEGVSGRIAEPFRLREFNTFHGELTEHGGLDPSREYTNPWPVQARGFPQLGTIQYVWAPVAPDTFLIHVDLVDATLRGAFRDRREQLTRLYLVAHVHLVRQGPEGDEVGAEIEPRLAGVYAGGHYRSETVSGPGAIGSRGALYDIPPDQDRIWVTWSFTYNAIPLRGSGRRRFAWGRGRPALPPPPPRV